PFGDIAAGGEMRKPERGAGDVVEVCLGDAVVLRRQLTRARRRRSERVELDREVSVPANGVQVPRNADDLASELLVGHASRCRGRGRGGTAESFGEAEELTPRLVNRRRVMHIRFVQLGDVRVVEDGRDGLGHESNLALAAGTSDGTSHGFDACDRDPGRRTGTFREGTPTDLNPAVSFLLRTGSLPRRSLADFRPGLSPDRRRNAAQSRTGAFIRWRVARVRATSGPSHHSGLRIRVPGARECQTLAAESRAITPDRAGVAGVSPPGTDIRPPALPESRTVGSINSPVSRFSRAGSDIIWTLAAASPSRGICIGRRPDATPPPRRAPHPSPRATRCRPRVPPPPPAA